MFVPLWLLIPGTLLLLVLLLRAFGSRGELIERQRRAAPPPTSDQLAALARPDIAAALAAGRKIEAIKLVREGTGLDLKEAKDLVERHERP